jgi:hypothetical protein
MNREKGLKWNTAYLKGGRFNYLLHTQKKSKNFQNFQIYLDKQKEWDIVFIRKFSFRHIIQMCIWRNLGETLSN